MRNDYTDLTIVLDRSGSMSSLKADMEGGFDQFMEEQKRLPGLLRVTLYQFDTEYERVYAGIGVQDVPKLSLEPRGMTALVDALGRAIDETGHRLRAMPESERPGKVLFMVITDGGENASKERKAADVKKLVQRQESEWKWTFVYLGANVDAFAESGNLGFSSVRAAGYGATGQSVKGMMHVNSANLASYRAAPDAIIGADCMSFSPDERQQMDPEAFKKEAKRAKK